MGNPDSSELRRGLDGEEAPPVAARTELAKRFAAFRQYLGRAPHWLWWIGGLSAFLFVLFQLAMARPEWPWFSLGLSFLLVTNVLVGSGKFRDRFNLTWPVVTFINLLFVCLFVYLLFHVETVRANSDRLVFRGVYFDPVPERIAVGVGHPGLDVHLQGSATRFDRWRMELVREGSVYRVTETDEVDMIELPKRGGLPSVLSKISLGGGRKQIIGAEIGPDNPALTLGGNGGSVALEFEGEGCRGALSWAGARAPLDHSDPILNRRLARGLANGVELASLPWDTIPDPAVARDLVITRESPEKCFRGLSLGRPNFRITSRSGAMSPSRPHADSADPEAALVPVGDTVWVYSRGQAWAFTLRHSSASSVSELLEVRFVRRPRPARWALPSGEDCSSPESCAVLSSEPLPPPQPYFHTSGFGLDTARYRILARLEVDGGQVSLAGKGGISFSVGEESRFPAAAVEGDPSAGLVLMVDREKSGDKWGTFWTLLWFFSGMAGALMTLQGRPREKRFWEAPGPHGNAAAWLLNLIIIFLGVRLALGLRVAYAPPYLERAADTAIGMWVLFALLLFLLGRWAAIMPRLVDFAKRLQLVSGQRNQIEPEKLFPRRGTDGSFASISGLCLLVLGVVAAVYQRVSSMGLQVGLAAVMCFSIWVLIARNAFRHGSLTWTESPMATLTARVEEPEQVMLGAVTTVALLTIATQVLSVAFIISLLILGGFARHSWRKKEVRHLFPWLIYCIVFLSLFLRFGDRAPHAVRFAFVLASFLLAVVSGSLCYRAFRDRAFRDRAFPASPDSAQGSMNIRRRLWIWVLGKRDKLIDWVKARPSAEILMLLTLPIAVLVVNMYFDFGLGLVFFIPMLFTVGLAASMSSIWQVRKARFGIRVGIAATALAFFLAYSVLRPSYDRSAGTVAGLSEEMEGAGGFPVDLARQVPAVRGAVDRAVIRGMAASDPEFLERGLATSGRSEALAAIVPSREQVWGAQAYAASEWIGDGFASSEPYGRGVPTAVSYAENTFSVFVLSEHGALGGLVVLLMYAVLTGGILVWVWQFDPGREPEDVSGPAARAVVVGGGLWIVLPAIYVAGSNVAVFPLTGQNMPFLGLNAWSDVIISAGIAATMVSALGSLAVESSKT